MVSRPESTASNRNSNILREVLLASAQALVISSFLYATLHGWQRDLRMPLRFTDDSVFFLMQAKTTVDTGWWWSNPWLSAPSTYNALAFPSNTNVDQFIVRLVSILTHNMALCLNVSWFVMVILSGLTATFCLRQLGLSRLISCVFGILYAISPYPLYRNVDHFNLVVYLVPFPCAVGLLLASGKILSAWRSKSLYILFCGCALLGFNYIYYSFFGAFFIVCALIVGYAAHHDARILRAGGAALVIIALCTAFNLMPSLYSWTHSGRPMVVVAKTPNQSEIFGLKIRQLVSPVFQHSMGPLSWWNHREAEAQFPLETENTISRLGIVGTLGFLCLLAVLFVPRVAAGSFNSGIIIAASRLNIAAILLATVGGFGSVFNLLVTPDIRAYNRICAFITFFALFALAALLDDALACSSSISRPWWKCVIALTLVTGIYDCAHVPIHLNTEQSTVARDYRGVQALVGKMEATLPRGSMVYELPQTVFLNESIGGRMHPYDRAKPYLVSHHLRWSYPALSNAQVQREESIARLTVEQMAFKLASDGFAAILIDRYGYDDDASGVIQKLGGQLGPTAVIGEDSRYMVFDLRGLRAAGVGIQTQAIEPTDNWRSCDYAALANVDQIGFTASPSASRPGVVSGSSAVVSGWAVDGHSKVPAAFVDVIVDGSTYPSQYGLDRTDVAEHFAMPGYRKSGFLAVLSPAQIGLGNHSLALRIVSPDRNCVAETPKIPFILR